MSLRGDRRLPVARVRHAVADAVLVEDVGGFVGGVAELAAEPPDRGSHAVGVAGLAPAPHLTEQASANPFLRRTAGDWGIAPSGPPVTTMTCEFFALSRYWSLKPRRLESSSR